MAAESEIQKVLADTMALIPAYSRLHCLLHKYTFMSTVTNNIWFEGPVSEAVALVNSRDCVFVVYIFGKSLYKLLQVCNDNGFTLTLWWIDDTDNTQKLNETLGNEDVSEE